MVILQKGHLIFCKLVNIVYVLYDISDNYKDRKNIFKQEIFNYAGILLFVVIVFMFWLFNNNLDNICILTLVLNLFVPVYVWIINMIKNKSK